TFLHHNLAVTETRVVLQEAAWQFHRELTVQAEPERWRRYHSSHGIAATLKPDLAAVVMSEDYDDRHFIEGDRDTENPPRVITKCWRYLHYQRSGEEQRKYGVYPAVVWIVPHGARKQQLTEAISSEPGLPRHLFSVITMSELEGLVRDGPTGFS